MGGNVLKELGCERKDLVGYTEVVDVVVASLKRLFRKLEVAPIPFYKEKSSFGDADILVGDTFLPSNWKSILKVMFRHATFVENGPVLSFDVNKFQVDLIVVPSESFDFALNYFSYNDLGNFMGRVAHRMGLKYGHLGLFAPLREGTNQFAEVLVTRNTEEAFCVLGYSYSRFLEGFNTLEEIFTFAMSSPYATKDIFLLENRNAKARQRDSKRPNYHAFLNWLELNYNAAQDVLPPVGVEWIGDRIPWFAERLNAALDQHEENKSFRRLWNGEVVNQITGLEGPVLGDFMAYCRNQPDFEEAIHSNWIDLWIQKKVLNFNLR